MNSEKRELIVQQSELNERILNLKRKIQEKTSECESLSLRINYLTDREKQEQNMFGQYRSPVQESVDSQENRDTEMNQITNALDKKNHQIEEDFKLLKQKFLNAAEQKMESLKENDGILEEIERIRKMHLDLKQQNADLKGTVEILNSKLDHKNKLNEHLEEKCANILIEKEDMIIKLKAEIVALKKKVKKQDEKHTSEMDELNRQKNNLEKNYQDLNEKHQKVINDQANFDNDLKRKVKELKKLSDEFKKHKKETKLLLEEKNMLIKDYEDRVKKLNELKQQQVNMIEKEREDLENELSVVKGKLKILNLKENFYKNKADKLLVQKEFLVKQIDNNLETMNNEYNKLQDLETQKDFMISVKKSNKNIQEVYFSGINNLKYFKEVIDFMNFNEFSTVNKILDVNNAFEDQHEKLTVSKSILSGM